MSRSQNPPALRRDDICGGNRRIDDEAPLTYMLAGEAAPVKRENAYYRGLLLFLLIVEVLVFPLLDLVILLIVEVVLVVGPLVVVIVFEQIVLTLFVVAVLVSRVIAGA
ncbi:MAG TPA: hypothetical protein VH393_08500 [Ktedonobacterales bacterium]